MHFPSFFQSKIKWNKIKWKQKKILPIHHKKFLHRPIKKNFSRPSKKYSSRSFLFVALDTKKIGKKKNSAQREKLKKKQNLAFWAQKLYNMLECGSICNYHRITTNRNFLREENYTFKNLQKRHQPDRSQFP